MSALLAGVVACVVGVIVSVNVSGTWSLEMLWPGGKSTGSCSFTIEGERLTGTCGGGEDRFPVTGRIDVRKLSWQMDVKQDGAAGRLEFAGEVDETGTTIKGSCSVGDQFGSFTMTRQ